MFRHYWVVVKLFITVVASVVLLMYTEALRAMGRLAADTSADLELVRNPPPILHAGAGLILLLVAVTLSVYKPPARTAFGRRRYQQRQVSP